MGISYRQKYEIVRLLLKRGAASRLDISQAIGVALPTVSTLVRDLMDRGIVCEDGFGQSAGGRKPARLALNPSFAGAIGIEVSAQRIAGLSLDLGGKVHARQEGPLPLPADRQGVLDAVFRIAETLVNGAEGAPLRGIGVGIGGVLGGEGRVSRELPFAEDWRDVPLADLIEERFGLRAVLLNDVQAAAMGEWRFGGRAQRRHLLYLHLGRSVGLGLVAEGRLCRGAAGNAGGLIHLDGQASPHAIAERFAATLAEEGGEAASLEMADVLAAAQDGHTVAMQILQEAGQTLGGEAARWANALNPEAVVFGGALAEGPSILAASAQSSFREGLLPTLRGETDPEASQVGPDACAMGAAAMIFDGFFRSPEALFGAKGASARQTASRKGDA